MRFILALLVVGVVGSVSAADGIRDGANHHLGDDSFVAAFGRMPGAGDSETLRMHTHLAYVRGLLGARAATQPDLAARRAELLGYLDDYIAAGTTPRNTYVPWRSPVFIDADGRICAVGYLIERSAGRALPERIAAAHRTAYLEDIAAAMPEVAAWVASSGLTIEELASIQPGYMGPEVQHQNGWDKEQKQPDGAFHEVIADVTMDGAFKRGQMVGTWKRTSEAGVLLGSGKFTKGSGTWKSVRADGSVMAQGPFDNSRPSGTWKFFHPSGRLAATGAMRKGKRAGTWTFFYDQVGKARLASGSFSDGEVVGDWKHFDAAGKLVATASGRAWAEDGLTLVIQPGADGVRHEITQGEPANNRRLDAFYSGKEKLFVLAEDMYDGAGNKLTKTGDAWTMSPCKWDAKQRRAASASDTGTLYHLFGRQVWDDATNAPKPEACATAATAVPLARAATLSAMLASTKTLHAPIPVWSIKPYVAAADADANSEPANESAVIDGLERPIVVDNPLDMTTMLADHMTWYMEWPYIDNTFVAVYDSVPGYSKPPLY